MATQDEGSVTRGIGDLKAGNFAELRAAPPATSAEAPTLAAETITTRLLPDGASTAIHETATQPPGQPSDPTQFLGAEFPPVAEMPADRKPGPRYSAAASGPPSLAPADPAAPARVRYFGDYQILREIARGGMGVVFHARQISLNRQVALKMILAGHLAREADLQRFATEAEAAANLDHPGIVPIFEIGQHEGQHFFSMGFVEGQSLAQRLADGPMPPREAAALMAKVAEAIEYAHRRGVIHRDLKPANILIDAQGSPRVTDFGLAKKVQADSGLTGSGQIMGTPSYMPPEQAGGPRVAVGPAADVYSLGATLYALVTGRPPFQAATAMETVLMVLGDEPVPPRRLNGSVPADLETICLKCLEKEPGKRYASAAEFAADLRRFLADEPIVARPVTGLERTVKWVRRRPAPAALLGVSALAVTTLVIVSLYYSIRLQDSNRRLQSALGVAREQERLALDHQAMTRRSFYTASMGLAQEAWQGRRTGYIRRIREFLEPWKPRVGEADLRSFEWNFLDRLVHADLREDSQDIDSVTAVAVSADGRRLAVGDKNFDHTGALRLLDAASGRLLWKRPFPYRVVALAFSPDGRLLASASCPADWPVHPGTMGSVTLHDVETGEERAQAGRVEAQPALAFAKDGSELLIADVRSSGSPEKSRRVWRADPTTGREIASFDATRTDPTGAGHRGFGIEVAEFSPDRDLLAVGGASSRGLVYLLDSRGGGRRGLLEAGTGTITSLAFAAEGGRLVGGAADDTIRLWDLRRSRAVWVAQQRLGYKSALALSPDGRSVAAANGTGLDGELVLRETGRGTELTTLLAHEEGLNGLAWLPDAHTLISISNDNTVKWWDAARTWLPDTVDAGQGEFSAMAAAADGRLLTVATVEPITFWNRAVGMKPDLFGKVAILRWWDARTQTPVATRGLSSPATCLAVSQDGKKLAVVAQDGRATLWEMETQRPLAAAPEWEKGVRVAAWSSDGRLALGTNDRGVTVWEPGSLERPKARLDHDSPVTALAWWPDGRRLVTAGHSQDAIVWDVAVGDVVRRLEGSVVTDSGFIAVSPDGRFLATDAWFDAVLRETIDWREVGKLHGHAARIADFAFAADGRTIATAANDDAVKLWDPETGQERFTFHKDHHAARAARFLANGQVLAVCWIGPQDKVRISFFQTANSQRIAR